MCFQSYFCNSSKILPLRRFEQKYLGCIFHKCRYPYFEGSFQTIAWLKGVSYTCFTEGPAHFHILVMRIPIRAKFIPKIKVQWVLIYCYHLAILKVNSLNSFRAGGAYIFVSEMTVTSLSPEAKIDVCKLDPRNKPHLYWIKLWPFSIKKSVPACYQQNCWKSF